MAQERGEAIGKTVGYKIRLESVASSSTRILFVTTGVLLRRLSEDPLLAGVSHVVVDEVHERSLDSDFLLVLLRDVLPAGASSIHTHHNIIRLNSSVLSLKLSVLSLNSTVLSLNSSVFKPFTHQ